MRFAMLVAAACAACFAVPAQAGYVIHGEVTGNYSAMPGCTLGSTSPACMAPPIVTVLTYAVDFSLSTGSVAADGSFVFGHLGGPLGQFNITGKLLNPGSTSNIQGINMVLDLAGHGLMGSADMYHGTAATFSGYYSIAANDLGPVSIVAVPEPATWGLLMVGFGGIGAALRRRSAQFVLG